MKLQDDKPPILRHGITRRAPIAYATSARTRVSPSPGNPTSGPALEYNATLCSLSLPGHENRFAMGSWYRVSIGLGREHEGEREQAACRRFRSEGAKRRTVVATRGNPRRNGSLPPGFIWALYVDLSPLKWTQFVGEGQKGRGEVGGAATGEKKRMKTRALYSLRGIRYFTGR